MVQLQTVYIITDDGFLIYNQSFGATEQDHDMISALVTAIKHLYDSPSIRHSKR